MAIRRCTWRWSNDADETVVVLLNQGADVYAKANDGDTPLNIGSVGIMLLRRLWCCSSQGADANARDAYGNDAAALGSGVIMLLRWLWCCSVRVPTPMPETTYGSDAATHGRRLVMLLRWLWCCSSQGADVQRQRPTMAIRRCTMAVSNDADDDG